MPTILTKRSNTPGAVPATANLTNAAGGAELAVNTADKRLFSINSSSAVIELGTNPSSLTCADVSATVLRAASATITNLIATSASITTLTNNPTFSAGTANGVLYLNGSKVATSGSALQFSGTNLSLGAAVTSLTWGQFVGVQANYPGVVLSSTASGGKKWSIGADAAVLTFRNETDSSTAAVIDGSNNVGIGTSSPAAKLNVVGGNIRLDNNQGLEWGGGNNYIYGNETTDFVVIATNGNERLRIDSSGNLGLGVTPSTSWFASSKAIQIGIAGAPYMGLVQQTTTTCDGYMLWGARLSGDRAFQYTSSGDAVCAYRQNAGTHNWFTAASGTAGNAISFGDAKMTLDASGNLLVGTTSGSNKLTVNGDAVLLANGEMKFADATNTHVSLITNSGAASTSQLEFWTGNPATERARISSDGTFRVKGAGTAGSTDAFLVDGAAPASAARITSGGVFCVNSTSNVGGEVTLFKQTSGVSSPATRFWNNSTTGDNEFVEFATETSYTARGSITYNRGGGLVAYNTTSDYRAKDILGPVQNSGATIDALKVYEGQMKGATQGRPMLVAHEAQEHAPYAVTGEKDAVNEDGTPKYQQMDVSALVPLLLAEIQSLRARVAQLESK
jgi:hypothetical protein